MNLRKAKKLKSMRPYNEYELAELRRKVLMARPRFMPQWLWEIIVKINL